MIKEFWSMATELPQAVFEVWHKPGNVISPVAVLAQRKNNSAPGMML